MESKLTLILRRALQCLLLFATVVAVSGASDPSTRFNEIGHQLMCTCGCAQVLLECNHVGCPASDSMRNELMAALSRGDGDNLVQQAFVQKYGPTVLTAPTKAGFDQTAWITPFIVLVLGFTLCIYAARSWKSCPTPAIASGVRLLRGADLEPFREQARRETEI